MSIVSGTFEAVGVLLAVGVLGFVVVSRRIVPTQALDTLSPLALEVALPSFVFVNILLNFQPEQTPGWWKLPLWWAGATVVFGVLTACAAPLTRRGSRREFAAALFYQNAVFVPLVILTEMFGPASQHLVNLFLFTMPFSLFFFSTSHLFYAESRQGVNWSRVFNPVLVASLLALILRLTGRHEWVPGFVVSGLRMVGHMAAPALLLLLGGNICLDWTARGRWQPLEVTKFVFVKNICFPAVMVLLVCWLRPPYEVAMLLILQSAVPPLTAIPIITAREGGNRALVNQFMLVSFVVSLLSIPASFALFEWWWRRTLL